MVADSLILSAETGQGSMLTGPVTILNWSFVRDDLPRKPSATRSPGDPRQIADLEGSQRRDIES